MDELTREERIALVERSVDAQERADRAIKEAERLERTFKKAQREGARRSTLELLAMQVAEAFERAGTLSKEAGQVTRRLAAAMPAGVTTGE